MIEDILKRIDDDDGVQIKGELKMCMFVCLKLIRSE